MVKTLAFRPIEGRAREAVAHSEGVAAAQPEAGRALNCSARAVAQRRRLAAALGPATRVVQRQDGDDELDEAFERSRVALAPAPRADSRAAAGGVSTAPLDLAATATTNADDAALEAWRAAAMARLRWQEAHPGVDADTYQGPDPAPPGPSTAHTQAEGALWISSGILGLAASLRDLFDDEKSAWDCVNALFGIAGTTSASIGAAAQIASTHISPSSDSAGYADASAFGSWGLGYQEMFSGLQAAVRTLRTVIEVVRLIADRRDDSQAWMRASGELLAGALEVSKGVLRSVRQVNETLGGSVSAQFATALPGLDIAILAVKSITQGYYLVVSAVSWHAMKQRETELTGSMYATLPGNDPEAKAAHIKRVRKHYRHREARIAELQNMIRDKDQKIQRERVRLGRTQSARQRERILHHIESMQAKRRRYEHKLDDARTALGGDILRAVLARQGPTRVGLAELDLAHMLRITNRKRVLRQSIHVGTNLVQIGSSIAALVSGPGAPAAIALKAAALGVDTSLPFLRWLKQKGRESAARSEAKGERGLADHLFDADKSTAAKLADRRKQAVFMLMMVHNLERLEDQAQRQERAVQVHAYLVASGVDTSELYAPGPGPREKVNLLVGALYKRELGE